ncbi:MAG: serine/threonine-protein kinase [Kofleriaceae bacterium]
MRDEEDTESALPDRPVTEGAPLARELARSKIGNALFGTEPARVGRYQLLQQAGAGGMGVVWSAWDPELERRVAVKVVRIANADTRALILKEGQALAKLAHPNVVAIYDVGSVDDQVYLVMEWIAGTTLLEARSLDTMRAAGEGLAAAHRAGIIHRDFKPTNVMVGADHRVRVLDFGLAVTDPHAAPAGTRGYMAPEQLAGDPITAAVDQYAFGIALRELVDPMPSWIARIVERATAKDPAARYPSMEELLAALARDPRRVWRGRWIATGVLALAGGAFVVGGMRSSDPAPCSGDALADVWNPVVAGAVTAHAKQLGPYGALEATALADHLAAYHDRWIAAHHGACEAHRRDELPNYDRALACLDRDRAAFDATVGAAARASLDHFADTVLAANALPDASLCTRELGDAPAPIVSALRANAERARFLLLAGDPAGKALADGVVNAAQLVGDRGLLAHAQLVAAFARDDESSASVAGFGTAADNALAAGDDITYVEAFARELFSAARYADQHPETLEAQLPVVVGIAARTGEAGRFARALLFNNAGTARLSRGDRAGARRWFEQAYAEPQPAERGIELWAIPGNLAMTVEDPARRDTLFVDEIAHLTHALGADHALTLRERVRAAVFADDPAHAAALLHDACAELARFTSDGARIAQCNWELGSLALARGDAAEAKRAFELVVDVPPAPIAHAALELLNGDAVGAARDGERSAKTFAAEPAWWRRIFAADAWFVVALAERAQHLPDKAARAAGLAVLAGPDIDRSSTFYKRRFAALTSD